jgi:hypothetical protein
MAKSTFGKAFAAARKAQGAGGTFVWLKSEGGDGETYSTNIAGETGKKSSARPQPRPTDLGKNEKIPRPQPRPASLTKTDNKKNTNTAGEDARNKVLKVGTQTAFAKMGNNQLQDRLKKTTVAGRGGYASGPAAGMPAKKTETAAEREKRIAAGTPLGKLMSSFSASPVRAIKKTTTTTTNPTTSRKAAIEAAMKKRNK